ncbi:hypothetical protein LIPSTDRAFT_68604 [Lipomyces starkeyi NRRL Y-11557]|uniref:Uncharacterized protein n=1 Tax=Lipomyces starkeyi NRRL Y-11557 TaxID=675824 RepID=A0A1E3QEP3_LIPST|nr:hypothetical protein LIPSTDRAFT_68604 [Lipomyces starkeyi NRRL Y-11557]
MQHLYNCQKCNAVTRSTRPQVPSSNEVVRDNLQWPVREMTDATHYCCGRFELWCNRITAAQHQFTLKCKPPSPQQNSDQANNVFLHRVVRCCSRKAVSHAAHSGWSCHQTAIRLSRKQSPEQVYSSVDMSGRVLILKVGLFKVCNYCPGRRCDQESKSAAWSKMS